MAYSLLDLIQGNPFDAAQNAAVGQSGAFPPAPVAGPAVAPTAQGPFPPAPTPAVVQNAPTSTRADMTSQVIQNYSPLRDPEGPLARAGWIGALLANGPSRQEKMLAEQQQYQQAKQTDLGAARNKAFSTLSGLVQSGMPAQKAFLQFLNTPEGADFIVKDPNPQDAIKQFLAMSGAPDQLAARRASLFTGGAGAPESTVTSAPLPPVTSGATNADNAASGPATAATQTAATPSPTTPDIGQRSTAGGTMLDPQRYLDIANKFMAGDPANNVPPDEEAAKQAIDMAKSAQEFQNFKNPPPTEVQKDYKAYVDQTKAAGEQPIDFLSYQLKLKTAGATMLNTVEGKDDAITKSKLALDTKAAEAAQTDAATAQKGLGLLAEAERLNANTPGGFAGKAAPVMSQIATTLGLPVTEQMSNAEALNAITMRLVSGVRQPGSTSDYEQRLYASAVPNLMQTQQGRAKIIDLNRRLFQQQVELSNVRRNNLGADDLDQKLAEVYNKPMLTDKDKKELSDLSAQGAQAAPASGTQQPTGQVPGTGYTEGQTAVGPNGQTATFTGGKWIINGK